MQSISRFFETYHSPIDWHETKYQMLNKYVLIFSVCGHTLFTPVFYLLNSDIALYNNIFCVFFDLFLLYLNSRWKLKTVHILYIIEITYHSFACIIIFGNGKGFVYYFFPLTLYIFLLRKNRPLKAILFSILTFLFVFQYFYLFKYPPEFPVTIIPVWMIYFLNSSASFFAIAFTAAQFSIFVDASEYTIIKAKEKAEDGERAKSTFLANMSHEIRSPLNSIMGMINLALFTDKDEEKKQYLNIAKGSADHMLTVINDILDYSKIEMNRMSLNITVFNIHHLIKNTMMAMDSSIYNRNLSMRYEISDSVPEIVTGDPSRIRQILINLISNAIKFTEKGSILVKCRNISDDDNFCNLEFSVEDTGIGIPENKIVLIFNRFTQIDTTEIKNYTGTGLGLAISKELVELMGGTIRVESRPGNGSIFTFNIILQKTPAEHVDENLIEKTPAEQNTHPLHVLIAEDIFTNWMLYEKYMEKMGHSFKIVENGNMVLDELESGSYDILLMDVEMPEMNGEETLRMIRSGIRGGNRDIPVIAMTGYTENDLKKTDYEFSGFLFKPIELEDLDRKIKEVMIKHYNI